MKVPYVRLSEGQRHLALVLLSQNYNIAKNSHQPKQCLNQLAKMYNRLHEIPARKQLIGGNIYEWTLLEPHNILLKEINTARNRWLTEKKDVQGINEILCKLADPKQKREEDLDYEK